MKESRVKEIGLGQWNDGEVIPLQLTGAVRVAAIVALLLDGPLVAGTIIIIVVRKESVNRQTPIGFVGFSLFLVGLGLPVGEVQRWRTGLGFGRLVAGTKLKPEGRLASL